MQLCDVLHIFAMDILSDTFEQTHIEEPAAAAAAAAASDPPEDTRTDHEIGHALACMIGSSDLRSLMFQCNDAWDVPFQNWANPTDDNPLTYKRAEDYVKNHAHLGGSHPLSILKFAPQEELTDAPIDIGRMIGLSPHSGFAAIFDKHGNLYFTHVYSMSGWRKHGFRSDTAPDDAGMLTNINDSTVCVWHSATGTLHIIDLHRPSFAKHTWIINSGTEVPEVGYVICSSELTVLIDRSGRVAVMPNDKPQNMMDFTMITREAELLAPPSERAAVAAEEPLEIPVPVNAAFFNDLDPRAFVLTSVHGVCYTIEIPPTDEPIELVSEQITTIPVRISKKSTTVVPDESMPTNDVLNCACYRHFQHCDTTLLVAGQTHMFYHSSSAVDALAHKIDLGRRGDAVSVGSGPWNCGASFGTTLAMHAMDGRLMLYSTRRKVITEPMVPYIIFGNVSEDCPDAALPPIVLQYRSLCVCSGMVFCLLPTGELAKIGCHK